MHVLNLPHLVRMGFHLFTAGIASWYGPGFWGHHTASGEPLVANRATCAMPSFRGRPFNVAIYAPSTGRWVLCRVNDHGPSPSTGRVVDLSEYAKQQLGVGDLTYVRIYRQ